MASSVSMLVLVTFLATASIGSANTFLKKDVDGVKHKLKEESIERRFLEEVRGITGKGPQDHELPVIRKALEPMWAALPKNAYGRLDNAQVRYALHRLFVQRHGWYIDGLQGDANNTSSNAEVEAEGVPAFLMTLFEQALGKSGLKLHELVVFGATLERLIHDDMIERLENVYGALKISRDQIMGDSEAEKALKAFMYMLIVKQDLTDEAAMEKGFAFLDKVYPAWEDNMQWLREVRAKAVPEAFNTGTGYTFKQMENATEQVSMQLGSFVGRECKRMKDALMEVDEQGTGRVLLSDFYKKGMEKGFHFVEKPGYLRTLGALDESQAGEPRLILPNFMYSPNNCLVDNGFYRVCCLNECESVMGELERTIGAPQATPERIVDFISKVSTSTVAAPRELPEKMRLRLEMVADRSGGEVPLYGRLFSQWLHFAFPRECPFPHMSGSTNPLAPSDYLKETSEKSSMSWTEVREYVANVAPAAEPLAQEDAAVPLENEEALLQQWHDEEEMLFMPEVAAPSVVGKLLRMVFSLAVLAFIVVAVVDAGKRLGCMGSVLGKAEKSHLV